MPQWRKLHVKTTDSFDVNEMPDDFTRLLWVLLPLKLDREGRGIDNPAWVRSQVFPLREDVTNEAVGDALNWFAERAMIERYQVNGRTYFYIPTWHAYQNTLRDADSVLPPPPGYEPVDDESDEPVKTSSGAGQEPVKSESSTDVDVEIEVETEQEEDIAANAAQAPENPPPKQPDSPKPKSTALTDNARAFLELFSAKRFANKAQREAVLDLERQFPGDFLVCARWAAEQGVGRGKAIGMMRTALPKWNKPKGGNDGHTSRSGTPRTATQGSGHNTPTPEQAEADRAALRAHRAQRATPSG